MDGVAAGVGEQPGQHRAPAHGVDDEVRGQRPAALVADAGDVQAAAGAPRLSAATATPRRTSRPGCSSAARANTCSSVGRRAVVVTSRSSPGRARAVGDRRRQARHRSSRSPPAPSSASARRAARAASTARPRAWMKCAWRNCATPARRPPVPREHGIVGHGRGVALEDGDAMSVARQHHRGGQSARSGTEHDRLRQGKLLRSGDSNPETPSRGFIPRQLNA